MAHLCMLLCWMPLRPLTKTTIVSYSPNYLTGDVLLLLFAFFITGTEPRNSLSDGVVASQNFFTVSNGVKQGGILSPHLFNVYMDD